ncbi:MAG TPA: NUDIX domain-containing protein [Prolixibacteraceae bacterium]|mgnify:CR=1 FL=1|nr:NUDIX domain-containing protein [Prolixibacteraceae bacterium]HPR59972.1 NUDIX domain-containing protein [Prolixibacteraceae bacterium]
MYKVFFNDRILFIGNNVQDVDQSGLVLVEVSDRKTIQQACVSFLNDEQKRNFLLHVDTCEKPHVLLSPFFKIVKAAGGLVVNNKNQFLCIKRWGIWDLPKGKIEKGETKKCAALREVVEETGINHLILKQKLITTYHIYQSKFHNNEWVLKPTYWYSMMALNNEEPVPQVNEDITEARWLTTVQVKKMVLPNTYPSLVSVFEQLYLCHNCG